MAKTEYKYTPSHIGSMTQSGKDFNILASNVPYEMLYKYDKAVRLANNNTGVPSSYDISKEIANSFIICAPQVEDTNNIYTETTTVRFYDENGDGQYTPGTEDTIIGTLDKNTVKEDKGSKLSYKDSGDFDLVVTDNDGVPVCLTPQFNDIDTRYFDVHNDVDTRKRKYCQSRTLTLSEDLSSTIDSSSGIVRQLPYNYTCIVPEENKKILISKYDDGNQNSKQYYIGTVGTDTTEENGVYSYISIANNGAPITSTDNNTSFTEISFTYLLDWNIRLQKWKDNTELHLVDLIDKVDDLYNRDYIYRYDTNHNESPTYLWTGTSDDYSNISAKYKNNPNYTFIISGDKVDK